MTALRTQYLPAIQVLEVVQSQVVHPQISLHLRAKGRSRSTTKQIKTRDTKEKDDNEKEKVVATKEEKRKYRSYKN